MPEWLDVSIFGLTLLVMLVGLAGLVVPVFPGIVVIWLAALGYGLVAGFGRLGAVLFAIISLLMLMGILADNLLMGARARQSGASWWSIGGALLAGVVGTILFPPIGGLIGALAALLLIEYARAGDWQQALEASKGLALGCGWAFVVRFALGLVMIGLWGVWALV
jgi:uncharacterized protein YqgC (DUF456 family)